MTRLATVLLFAITALGGCAGTPERHALDSFNDTVGTANRTASNIRTIDRLIN
ncbi:MAG TPA: hypothetical protein PKC09_02095 [Paracoccus sp. (in: a-proteobacteria)]|uniref:hypothetical protein n=1 Tax=uncultured Paracoccus sp. TaxID=189685 RepID=UPI002625B3FB|nr:hypothetical protein [uncultured Paracoccus sp.]HMQ40041.1 hypothetical protein [Paracoccus sp. (in: a-proteobacteria)]HMR35289.1 hypothetical protein [Paracoccus sp. (in: a-proteobacteria)]